MEREGQKKAELLLTRLLDLGKRMLPGAELLASVQRNRSANTRFACSEITSTGDVDETQLRLHAFFGRRHAAAEGNQTDDAGLRALVQRAGQLGRIAPEDPEYLPLLPPQHYPVVPSAFDDATARLGARERAAAIAGAIAQGDAQKLQVAGFYQHQSGLHALGSTSGLRAFHPSTQAQFTTTARTPDGSGSGWAGAISSHGAELDPGALARVAIDKAVRSRRPQRLAPGRYTVILEPAAVADLLGFLLRALDARTADEGRSFFSRPGGGNRIGDKLAGSNITLRADPTEPATPGAPFGEDGLPLRRQTFIDQGVISGLWYSRYWAQQKGKEPTGRPTVAHLLGGQSSDADLLQGVQRGVLITRFWYTRWLDPQSILITGLTRDGVFLIENGQVTSPVNNFRFNESPVTMLKNADALTANTVRAPSFGTLLRVPALRTHEFHLASISEAV